MINKETETEKTVRQIKRQRGKERRRQKDKETD